MNRLRHPASLRVRLLVFLLAAIALTAAVQGLLAYRSALVEADALFDYQMQQTAYALRAGLPPDARASGNALPEYQNDELIVQVWTNEGLRIFESAVGAALPQKAVLGFTELQARGISYRVFSLQTRSQVIQVAQDMSARRAMARALALRSLLPLAVMAPLLALAVWWAVSRLLAPVQRVRGQLAQRRPDDLTPVSGAGLPSELQPLVHEFNALLARVQALNADAGIHGILVQLPLPPQFNEQEILEAIAPEKDVDGFHAENVGALLQGKPRFIPCTPYGVIKMLEASGVDLVGMDAVVIGRSNIVGKPMAALLINAGATVTVCHSKTKNLAEHVARADLVVAAVGRAKFVTPEMLKPGAVVIDVGINRLPDGTLCGDVDFAACAAVAEHPQAGEVSPSRILRQSYSAMASPMYLSSVPR